MRKPDERAELIRAVRRHGETVVAAATRLGVPLSTAHRWMRLAVAEPPPVTFVEVVGERAAHSTIEVRIGAAAIEVRSGFDARLLREVVDALGSDA
ncbi:MAG: helix-turn-helix domain-containing protein [Deltaproteobacteria bacterium]|nr:helix-turn-helix domain-containing protein [Deltaproteobacteria bacterium]